LEIGGAKALLLRLEKPQKQCFVNSSRKNSETQLLIRTVVFFLKGDCGSSPQ
jgi:hypothetical protein